MIWRGERERTVDEVSKRPNRCRNRAWALPPGQAREQTWKLPARHPAFRRREARSGSGMERESLSSRCKGRDVQAAKSARTRVPTRDTGTEWSVVGKKVL